MTTIQHIKLGRYTALISFLLGTVVFGLYFLTSSFGLLIVGYVFIVLAGLVNLAVLISILVRASKDSEHKKQLWATCGLMLLNIPIMLLYCWFTTILLDTMRITFTNSTQVALTDINIVGCSGGRIDTLGIEESKTVWVEIGGDCSIHINYLLNGQQKSERVVDYATGGMGQKMKYNIGGQNEEQF